MNQQDILKQKCLQFTFLLILPSSNFIFPRSLDYERLLTLGQLHEPHVFQKKSSKSSPENSLPWEILTGLQWKVNLPGSVLKTSALHFVLQWPGDCSALWALKLRLSNTIWSQFTRGRRTHWDANILGYRPCLKRVFLSSQPLEAQTKIQATVVLMSIFLLLCSWLWPHPPYTHWETAPNLYHVLDLVYTRLHKRDNFKLFILISCFWGFYTYSVGYGDMCQEQWATGIDSLLPSAAGLVNLGPQTRWQVPLLTQQHCCQSSPLFISTWGKLRHRVTSN